MDLRNALRICVIPDRKAGAPLTLEEQADRALQGGATMIQLRCKEMNGRELYETAIRIIPACRRRGAFFIVNDRLDVALAAAADGVHLGREDLPVEAARRRVPKGFIVGATAHSAEEGTAAEAAGADYVGIGAAFPSGAKKNTGVIGVEGVRKVVSVLSIPAVAIGGIGEGNVSQVMAAGVDGVAVISSVVSCIDIAGAVRRLSANMGR